MNEKSTPKDAIRKHCLECCGGQANEVKLCHLNGCALYPFRLGKEIEMSDRERVCRSKAIKLHCDSCGEEPRSKCTLCHCPLYEHRV